MKCEKCGGSGSICNYEHPEGSEYCLKCKICPDCNGTGKQEGEMVTNKKSKKEESSKNSQQSQYQCCYKNASRRRFVCLKI